MPYRAKCEYRRLANSYKIDWSYIKIQLCNGPKNNKINSDQRSAIIMEYQIFTTQSYGIYMKMATEGTIIKEYLHAANAELRRTKRDRYISLKSKHGRLIKSFRLIFLNQINTIELNRC